jgi:hypothetical protein
MPYWMDLLWDEAQKEKTINAVNVRRLEVRVLVVKNLIEVWVTNRSMDGGYKRLNIKQKPNKTRVNLYKNDVVCIPF